jgi:hypothetical protein
MLSPQLHTLLLYPYTPNGNTQDVSFEFKLSPHDLRYQTTTWVLALSSGQI